MRQQVLDWPAPRLGAHSRHEAGIAAAELRVNGAALDPLEPSSCRPAAGLANAGGKRTGSHTKMITGQDRGMNFTKACSPQQIHSNLVPAPPRIRGGGHR